MPRFFGAPEVTASGDGRLELFVFDTEGVLWHLWQTRWSDSNSWSTLCQESVTGQWPVTVASGGDGRLNLFVAGDALWHSEQTAWSNGWSPWTVFPPVPPVSQGLGFFAPAIASNADGRLELFVANGALWRSEQTAWSNGWSGWLPHGSPDGALVLGPPTAGRSGDGRIEVFVIDQQGLLWNIRQTSPGGTFSGWNAFGTPGVALADRPGLARSADGRLELFVRGTDGRLYHQWETAVGTFAWSGWNSFDAGSVPASGFADHPVAAPSADGRLEIFLTGNDGNVYHSWQTAASNGWSDPWLSEGSAGGGFGAAAPGLARNGDGRLELFAVGLDGNLYHKWQTVASNGWSPWELLQPQPAMTAVPPVVGLTEQKATSAIDAAHLVPEFGPPPQQGVPVVATQDPVDGTRVPDGTTVHMTLKAGIQPR